MASPRIRPPPYLVLLVVAFVLLGLVAFHSLRERRVWNDLLEDKESDINRLENELQFYARLPKPLKMRFFSLLLKQREKNWASELRNTLRKVELQRDKLVSVTEDLNGQLTVLKNINSTIEGDKKRLESSLQDSENEVSDLKEKLDLFEKKEQALEKIQDEIFEKDTVINELKAQLTKALGLSVPAPEANAENRSYKVGGFKGSREREERIEQASETEGRHREQGGDTEGDTNDTGQERATNSMKENEHALKDNVLDETSSKEDIDEDGEAEKGIEEVETENHRASMFSETEGHLTGEQGEDTEGDRGDTRDLHERTTGDVKENENDLKDHVRDEDEDVDEDAEAKKTIENSEKKDQPAMDMEDVRKADHEEEDI